VQPNRVFGTNGNNNLSGTDSTSISDIIGGDDGNDTASGGGGDDHITGGAGADNLTGGSGNDIIIGGSQSQNENQTVRAADGADTIDGGEGNDFIVGNQGNDVLLGGLGADTILGGSGEDQITGGQGDDVINLAGGGNDVVRYNTTLDGHDIITGFDSNNDGGTDQLNLDALFNSLGVADGDRAGRVQIDDPGGNGGTVNIRVDTNGDATFDLHVATITTTTANPLAVGTEIIVT
jgi:Ca2+-binding RTX toxin-like protein